MANDPLIDVAQLVGGARDRPAPERPCQQDVGHVHHQRSERRRRRSSSLSCEGPGHAVPGVARREGKRYFGEVSDLSIMPEGYEGALKQLRDAQEAATLPR